jgi:hypothetical protein
VEILEFILLFTLLMFHTVLNLLVAISLITGYLVLNPIKGALLFVTFTLSTVFFWFALFETFPITIGYI